MSKSVTIKKPHFIRRLYDWVLHWAKTPYGGIALFILAFSESSFFPIPPDVLLIALCIGVSSKSFRYALICSIGSVLGGILGYWIGLEFFNLIGKPIIDFYGLMDKYLLVQKLYDKNAFWAVAAAGFTPIPYKVFTIAAGAFKINFWVFLLASALSRPARFYLVSLLIWKYGAPIKSFIDKYFNLLSIIFFVLVVLGFIVLKYLIH